MIKITMATSTIGTLTEFKPKSKKIKAYLERVQLFFNANGITDDNQVTVLLTVIGSSTYTLLSSLLVALCKPCENYLPSCPRHFDSKPSVIEDCFHFHRHNQASGESISEYVGELRRLGTYCQFGNYLWDST